VTITSDSEKREFVLTSDEEKKEKKKISDRFDLLSLGMANSDGMGKLRGPILEMRCIISKCLRLRSAFDPVPTVLLNENVVFEK
jgi:hypothetical protein